MHPAIPLGDEAINREAGVYIAADGTLYPVTNWFDGDGEECTAEQAVRAVAGDGDIWFMIDLAGFEGVMTQ